MQKDHVEMLQTASSIAQRMGMATLALGTNIAHIAMMPKQAATDLLATADKLEELQSEVLDLANQIIDWEQSALRVGVAKGLVDKEGNPLR